VFKARWVPIACLPTHSMPIWAEYGNRRGFHAPFWSRPRRNVFPVHIRLPNARLLRQQRGTKAKTAVFGMERNRVVRAREAVSAYYSGYDADAAPIMVGGGIERRRQAGTCAIDCPEDTVDLEPRSECGTTGSDSDSAALSNECELAPGASVGRIHVWKRLSMEPRIGLQLTLASGARQTRNERSEPQSAVSRRVLPSR